MASSDDPERQPLLGDESKGVERTRTDGVERVPQLGASDSVSYNTATLGSLWILGKTSFTVWRRPALWKIAGLLFLFSFMIAILVLYTVDDPASLKGSKFSKLGTFLNVFVALLLGFFMSASMGRWYDCANGFMDLFDAVRTLQMQFYSLGVSEGKVDQVLRYGVLSARMLAEELHCKASPTYGQPEIDEMWNNIASNEGPFSFITPEELKVIKQVNDPSGTIWLWVTMMLGRMAEDGDVPPMPSPTYGRLMGLAQSGHGGVRTVRASVNVQPPFIYVQILAALVHINNIINAISFGMTWGMTLGTTLERFHITPPGANHYSHGATMKDVGRDVQNVIVSFFFSCFGPFIYQALLEVAIAIAQPFSSHDGEIPTKRLIKNLERDLVDAKMVVRPENLPEHITQPYFKVPVALARSQTLEVKRST